MVTLLASVFLCDRWIRWLANRSLLFTVRIRRSLGVVGLGIQRRVRVSHGMRGSRPPSMVLIS